MQKYVRKCRIREKGFKKETVISRVRTILPQFLSHFFVSFNSRKTLQILWLNKMVSNSAT